MTVKWPDVSELNQRAFAILSREMGILDTLRFFGQLGLGRGNYTEERRHLFDGLTIEDVRREVEKVSKGSLNSGA